VRIYVSSHLILTLVNIGEYQPSPPLKFSLFSLSLSQSKCRSSKCRTYIWYSPNFFTKWRHHLHIGESPPVHTSLSLSLSLSSNPSPVPTYTHFLPPTDYSSVTVTSHLCINTRAMPRFARFINSSLIKRGVSLASAVKSCQACGSVLART
jgi:hypothetical protein